MAKSHVWDKASGDKYRVDPNFVVPEPTPADRFYSPPDPGTRAKRQKLVEEVASEWRGRGVKQMRVTLTGPGIDGDASGYPAGMWFEGWDDESARQLPFGASWPTKDSAVWPPLTYASGILTEGGDAKQAPSDSLSSPTAESGGARNDLS